jgi:hypothetical protein
MAEFPGREVQAFEIGLNTGTLEVPAFVVKN